MTRAGPLVVAPLAGVLLAAAAIVGSGAASQPRPAPTEPLALDRYCRHAHDDHADAFHPSDPSTWGCSVRLNGVWGLEDVDLLEACRWQHGDEARYEILRSESASRGSEVVCEV